MNDKHEVSRWSRVLTIVGVCIAVINMSLAWTMMFVRKDAMPQVSEKVSLPPPPKDVTTIKDQNYKSYLGTSQEDIKSLVQAQMEQRRQEHFFDTTNTVLLLGFSFAVVAIGFSLFVMGIESVFTIHAEARDVGSLILKATSPGVLCIFVGALLVGISLVGRMEMSQDVLAKAELLQAEADAKREAAEAEADLVREKVQAEQTVAEAKAELIRAEAEAKSRGLNAYSTDSSSAIHRQPPTHKKVFPSSTKEATNNQRAGQRPNPAVERDAEPPPKK